MSDLVLYNTRTREKSVFEPFDPKNVGLYLCGPTVYDLAHLGNARNVVVFDILVRVLKTKYPRVTYVRNITDIDDKIMDKAKELGVEISEITTKTTAEYHEDMKALWALSPTFEPRATEHVPEMIAIINRLIQREKAYVEKGHVLFSVSSYTHYGTFSGHVLDHQNDRQEGTISTPDAAYKRHDQDFVLWKPSTDSQPGWNSPWGRGRPGWHIECSAMSWKYLGESFDIHGGGTDLIFPHHENEMAQSCCAFQGSWYARYWVHNQMILVNGEKMSKSLNNFKTVRDVLSIAPGEAVRFLLMKSHYRSNLDYSDDALLEAKGELDKFYRAIELHPGAVASTTTPESVLKPLRDDLNTPGAIAALHVMASSAMTGNARAASDLLAAGKVLGLLNVSPNKWFRSGDSKIIEQMIADRQVARTGRDFARADQIRKELAEIGVILEDGPTGTTWRKI